ncbi:MAG: CrcB family protein [Balneolia bacterium]|nr:CrcB family protein [Balneolia bacterium]
MVFLAVMAGGALGALSRYLIDGLFKRKASGVPGGTFIINVTGSFGAGFTAGLIHSASYEIPELWVFTIVTGFLSSYTTFSTWMVQSADLWKQHDYINLFINIVGQVVTGLFAALAGIWLAGII